MADEIDVMEDDTSLDSSPDDNTDTSESSQDTPADAPLKADKGTRDKANERIRDLVEQRNALAAQLQAVQQGQRPQVQQPQFDGVTDEGIDPQKFAASLQAQTLQQTRDVTQAQVAFQFEIMEVRKDPVLASKVAQEHISSLINQGIKPTEALEIYKDDLKRIEADVLARAKNRKEANEATREGTTISSSGKSSERNTGSYTWAQIDSMPMDEYRKNQAEIKRQVAAGLIK